MKLGIVGDIAIDHIGTVDSFPELNSNSGILELEQGFGGSAANTAVMCAQLGSDVKLLGCVGADLPEDYSSKLRSLGLSEHIIRTEDSTTSAFIFSKKNEQLSFFYKGASRNLNEIDPPEGILDCEIIHLCRNYDRLFLKIVKRTDSLISFNPGYGLDEIKKTPLKRLLKRVNFLFINEHEEKYLKRLFKKDIRSLGPEVLVKTLGPKGSIVKYKSREIRTPIVKTKLVDPTGAGDGFAAGFLTGLIEELELEECARLGTAAASRVIRCHSTQPLFSRKEIERIALKCGKSSKKKL